MIIGVPKEIRAQEERVALTPSAARTLVRAGHAVLIQQGAGHGSGLTDDEYIRAGSEIVPSAEDVWSRADLVWKVEDPLPAEMRLLRPGQVLFCFLHLPVRPDLSSRLVEQGVYAFGMETFQTSDGTLPLQRPLSEIAGHLAILEGSRCLQVQQGGLGILLGGSTGVPAARVVILGAGTVGRSAARAAIGLGAEVRALDVDLEALRWFDTFLPGRVHTLFATPHAVEESLLAADLVVGAALVPGHRSPRLVSRDQVGLLQPGAVLVDVAVDMGGCFETTVPGTLERPTRIVDGVVHHAVPNLCGAVPRTATYALVHAALPVGLAIAARGSRGASEEPFLASGLCVSEGEVRHAGARGT
ncbi:MAG: alanine dehydrogenase [Deltaproteobacteria bacterium]|nr:alanine dehydrogenase [Deltaproteobacteria bacterium]